MHTLELHYTVTPPGRTQNRDFFQVNVSQVGTDFRIRDKELIESLKKQQIPVYPEDPAQIIPGQGGQVLFFTMSDVITNEEWFCNRDKFSAYLNENLKTVKDLKAFWSDFRSLGNLSFKALFQHVIELVEAQKSSTPTP